MLGSVGGALVRDSRSVIAAPACRNARSRRSPAGATPQALMPRSSGAACAARRPSPRRWRPLTLYTDDMTRSMGEIAREAGALPCPIPERRPKHSHESDISPRPILRGSIDGAMLLSGRPALPRRGTMPPCRSRIRAGRHSHAIGDTASAAALSGTRCSLGGFQLLRPGRSEPLSQIDLASTAHR